MERPTSALTYKGSIPNAIAESRKHKKLFVVFVSGEDESSVNLEQSTWKDPLVAEAISRCCIFLHLMQGSVDASQFSAIYPQKSIPSISVIGLNGVMLWHHDGYISAKNLAESIEKAWATLHLQETAVTFLTAALASKEPQPFTSNSTNSSVIEQGTSSSSDLPSISADSSTQDQGAQLISDAQQPMENIVNELGNQNIGHLGDDISLLPESFSDAMIIDDDGSASRGNTCKETPHSALNDVDSSETCNHEGSTIGSLCENLNITQTGNSSLGGERDMCPAGSFQEIVQNVEETSKTKMTTGLTDCSDAVKTKVVHLNIRMPNGTSLQTKLNTEDTLISVKDFVDKNQNSQLSSYDLAVPYPRKLFNDQDMSRTLSELGFASREALIVIPRRQANRPPWGQSQSSDVSTSVSRNLASESSGGYFGYVRRVLSYMNPFAYFGGTDNSSSSEPGLSDGLVYQRPHPSLRNNLSSSEGSNPGDNVRDTRRTMRPFGSNIHTLRQNDDGPSDDRNVFWNGNSTQFGGDNK